MMRTRDNIERKLKSNMSENHLTLCRKFRNRMAIDIKSRVKYATFIATFLLTVRT